MAIDSLAGKSSGSAISEQMVAFEVFRYRPEEESEPVYHTYDVPVHKDWVVLDGLNHIKDHIDGTLSFRWSCRMGVCGSCGMMVNGDPTLTCATFIESLLPGPIKVEPLENFPVVRDLVIEMSDFMEKLESVKPWIIRSSEKSIEDGEYLQSPAQLADFKEFSMCINCMLCYAACPVYGLEPSFTGPAVIALAQRYNLDSRDQGASERSAVLNTDEGIWQCTLVGECSVVCPEHVDPAAAIQRYKVSSTLRWYQNLFMPWSRK